MSVPYPGNPSVGSVPDIRAPIVIADPVASDAVNASLLTTALNRLADYVAELQETGIFSIDANAGSRNIKQIALPGDGTDNNAHIDWTHTQTAPYHLLDIDTLAGPGFGVLTYDGTSPGGRSLVINCFYSIGLAQWQQLNAAAASWKITLAAEGVTGGFNGVRVSTMPPGSANWADADWNNIINTSLATGLGLLELSGVDGIDQTILTIDQVSNVNPAVQLNQGGTAPAVSVRNVGAGAGAQPLVEAINTGGGASSYAIQGKAVGGGAGTGVAGNADGSGSGVNGNNTGTGPGTSGQSSGGGPGLKGSATGVGDGTRSDSYGTGAGGTFQANGTGEGAVGSATSGNGLHGRSTESGAALMLEPQTFYPANPTNGQIIFFSGPIGYAIPGTGQVTTETGIYAFYLSVSNKWGTFVVDYTV